MISQDFLHKREKTNTKGQLFKFLGTVIQGSFWVCLQMQGKKYLKAESLQTESQLIL